MTFCVTFEEKTHSFHWRCSKADWVCRDEKDNITEMGNKTNVIILALQNMAQWNQLMDVSCEQTCSINCLKGNLWTKIKTCLREECDMLHNGRNWTFLKTRKVPWYWITKCEKRKSVCSQAKQAQNDYKLLSLLPELGSGWTVLPMYMQIIKIIREQESVSFSSNLNESRQELIVLGKTPCEMYCHCVGKPTVICIVIVLKTQCLSYTNRTPQLCTCV